MGWGVIERIKNMIISEAPAMTDLPRSLPAFQQHFPDDAACAAYLAGQRWPDGFVCPACGHAKGWMLRTKALTRECARCSKQTSVTAGMVMHGSKLPLTTWFWAAYLMATHSNGISALQLQGQLGLGSYKSAWLLCAKLRRAMVAPGRMALSGLVEVDETTMNWRRKGAPPPRDGRNHDAKLIVAGAVEVAGAGPGRIRLAPIPDFSADSLHAFIAANLAPGATAKTDAWPAYPGAPGVTHKPHTVGKQPAHHVLPWIHRVFANLKTWALGVYHGLRPKHLQAYLDEFTFRFNRRHTRHAAFKTLLGIGLALKPATYNMLIEPEPRG
jgi:hypothetical protein